MKLGSDIHFALLTAVPRSGTTWVGEVLSAHRRVVEVYEPFNSEGSGAWFGDVRLPRRIAWNDEAAAHVAAVRSLRTSPPPRSLQRIPGWARREATVLRAQLVRGSILVKDPTIPLIGPQVAELLGGPAVYLVRHPAGVASGYQRMGWAPDPRASLEAVERLDRVELQPLERNMRFANSSPPAAAAFWWLCVYASALSFADVYDHVSLVRYEDLVADRTEFERLAGRMGLPFGAANGRVWSALSSGSEPTGSDTAQHHLRRDPAAAAASWRSRLGASDLRDVRLVTEEVAASLGYEDW